MTAYVQNYPLQGRLDTRGIYSGFRGLAGSAREFVSDTFHNVTRTAARVVVPVTLAVALLLGPTTVRAQAPDAIVGSCVYPGFNAKAADGTRFYDCYTVTNSPPNYVESNGRCPLTVAEILPDRQTFFGGIIRTIRVTDSSGRSLVIDRDYVYPCPGSSVNIPQATSVPPLANIPLVTQVPLPPSNPLPNRQVSQGNTSWDPNSSIFGLIQNQLESQSAPTPLPTRTPIPVQQPVANPTQNPYQPVVVPESPTVYNTGAYVYLGIGSWTGGEAAVKAVLSANIIRDSPSLEAVQIILNGLQRGAIGIKYNSSSRVASFLEYFFDVDEFGCWPSIQRSGLGYLINVIPTEETRNAGVNGIFGGIYNEWDYDLSSGDGIIGGHIQVLRRNGALPCTLQCQARVTSPKGTLYPFDGISRFDIRP